MDVVGIIRRHERRLDGTSDLEQLGVRRLLFRNPVILDLDEEVVATEDVLQSCRLLERAALVTVHERLQHLTAEAATGDDETGRVLLEQLPVDLGLHVVALEERAARELDEVRLHRLSRRCDPFVLDVRYGCHRPGRARIR